MNHGKFVPVLKFLLQAAVVGLAAAFVLVWFFPGLVPVASGRPHVGVSTADQPGSYHAAVAAVAPAVVNVYAAKAAQQHTDPLMQDPFFRRFFGNPAPSPQVNIEYGSGVILNPDGYIITNVHIIENASAIQVTLVDGRQSTASIVGVDAATELAVLQLNNLNNLPTAPIGDSDSLQVGDVVLAIGNPYDFGQTVTQGIVSATGRVSLGITAIEDYIQTDADINPGNSGGALVNAAGELVGINTANYSDTGTGGSQGIGFAIPVNLVMDVMQQLIDYGHVIRGWLGIEARAVPDQVLKAAGLQRGGVLVTALIKNGPAATAGIQPGDILTQFDGKALQSPRQAIQLITRAKPGTEIRITVVRGWKQMQVTAKVAQRPPQLR